MKRNAYLDKVNIITHNIKEKGEVENYDKRYKVNTGIIEGILKRLANHKDFTLKIRYAKVTIDKEDKISYNIWIKISKNGIKANALVQKSTIYKSNDETGNIKFEYSSIEIQTTITSL